MGSEIKKETLSFCEEREKLKGEKSVDAELTLPDYCGDVKRILKCILTPQVHSVNASGDKINIRGTALIRVIYADEKENIDCCEKSTDFSMSLQSSHTEGRVTVVAEALSEYVNCRAVSRRKVSVNGSVAVICRVFAGSFTEIPCCAPDGVEICKNKRNQSLTVCVGEKSFEMSETVALTKDVPSVGKILLSDAWIETESLKAVQDKLLVKGELCVKTVYLAEGEVNKICSHLHKMPLSQIIDVDGIDESCEVSVQCRIGQLTVTGKSDSSHSGRLIDISARINCFISAEKSTEYEYISDCYCTRGRHTAEYAVRQVSVPVYLQSRVLKLKKSIQLPTAGEVCCGWVSECSTEARVSGNTVHGVINVTACFLCMDDNGAPLFCEREIEFESDTQLDRECTSPDCSLRVNIRDVSVIGHKDGEVDFTAEAEVTMRVYDCCSDRYVCDIKETDAECKKSPALTVYYCEGGEKIWDIAKKHSTTVALIKSENGIDGDTVAKKRMLLIPCV